MIYISMVFIFQLSKLNDGVGAGKGPHKKYIKETKKEIALFDDPMDQYDLTDQDKLEVIKDGTSN